MKKQSCPVNITIIQMQCANVSKQCAKSKRSLLTAVLLVARSAFHRRSSAAGESKLALMPRRGQGKLCNLAQAPVAIVLIILIYDIRIQEATSIASYWRLLERT